MKEEENEKFQLLIKIILLFIAYSIIGICGLFFILVSKVKAIDYINFYNNNGILRRCEQTNSCYYNLPSYTGYEFGNSISLTTNIDLTVRIQYTTEYQYSNWTINESGLYVFLRGSSITPLTCTDSGTQTTTGSNWITKTYNHNITCTLAIVGTDAYEIGLAMTVSQVEGNNYSAWVENTLTITNFNVTTTPNTTGIENAINSGNTNIINNSNQNTQTIIDNQNNNNQAVIDNQNQNTDRLEEAIEKQNNKCETYDYTKTNTPKAQQDYGYLNNLGQITRQTNWYVSNYIKLNENKNYNLNISVIASSVYYCLYGEDKSLISCNPYTNNNNTININYNGYIRYSFPSERFNHTLTFTGEYCYNLLEEQNKAQQEQNDFLMDNTPADANIISGIQVTPDTPVSSLLTLPIRLVQSVLDNLNGQCADYSFGSLYNYEIKLKCSDIRNIPTLLGSAYNIIDYLMAFFMIYNIFMLLIHAYETITTLNDDFHNIYETKTYYDGRGFTD